MATKVTAEFNIFAVSNDPRVLWLQYNLALAGVLKTNAFGIKSPEEKEREERRKDEEFYAAFRQAMATQEQIEAFHIELTKFDEERIELLSRTEEQLRQTREKLKRLRDEAPEMNMPDGTRQKLFRDGDRVRNEDGTAISADIVRPEAVSADEFNWQKFNITRKTEAVLTARRDRLVEDGEKIARARELSAEGRMSPKEMTEFNNEMKKEMAALSKPVPETETELAKEMDRSSQLRGAAMNAFASALDAEENAASGPDKKVRPSPPSAPAPM